MEMNEKDCIVHFKEVLEQFSKEDLIVYVAATMGKNAGFTPKCISDADKAKFFEVSNVLKADLIAKRQEWMRRN